MSEMIKASKMASNSYGQPGSSFSIVGNPNLGRRDTYNKLIGKKRFTSDIQPSDVGIASATGFLYMGYVTCPYPNALIKSIDVSAAEAAGAITLTGYDYEWLPENDYYSTSGLRTRGALPTTQARYCGMPVVAVGAATPDLCNDAINLVKVVFEPLPYVFDAEGALETGAPQLWPNGNSPAGTIVTGINTQPALQSSAQDAYGDAAAAIADADQVVTVTLDTDVYQHGELEPRCSVVQYTEGTVANADASTTTAATSATGTIINIWTATEEAEVDQADLASWFALPTAQVAARCSLGGAENGSTGGSFGNKIPPYEGEMIAAAMSKKSGLAVKVVYSKTNNFQAGIARWCERSYLTAAAKNGMITAFQGKMYTNVGALGGSNSDLGEFYAIYNVPNLNVVSYSVNTNDYGTAGAMRNVGESQNTWFVETAMDMLAEKYNMDPVQFRLQNLKTSYYVDSTTTPPTVYNDTAFDPTTGYPFSACGQPAHLLLARNTFNWKGRWQGWGVPSAILTNSGQTQGTGTKLRGVGVSVTSGAKGSLRSPDNGQIMVMPSGAVSIYSCIMDHGAGGPTTIPMIAAEALGLTLAQYGNSVTTPGSAVTAYMADTTLTTNSGETAGSAGTRNMGLGVWAAAANLGTQWFPLVAAKLAAGTKSTNLAFGGGTSGQPSGIIYDTTNPSNQMTFSAACALLPTAGLKGWGNYTPPTNTAYRIGGSRFCEVEVDAETADVRVIDFVGGLCIGRIMHPLGCEAQTQGGLIYGVSETFFDQVINDSSTGLKYSGASLNPNYLDTKVASIYQTPNRNLAVHYENLDPYAPYGAVGMGENSLMGMIPVILQALSNALGGYRFTKVPVRKEDIVAALQWLKQQPNSPI